MKENCYFLPFFNIFLFNFYLLGFIAPNYDWVDTDTATHVLPKYEYVITNRSGKYRLFVDGIPYSKHDSHKDRIYWRCSYAYKMERYVA